ncbi:MAG: hypothetical protein AMXMBFR7_19570 [Planctomycetota bacterium]
MKFYFCETCGKRVTEVDLASGQARDKKMRGMYCEACAGSVMTLETEALTEEQARGVLKEESPGATPAKPISGIQARPSSTALRPAKKQSDPIHETGVVPVPGSTRMSGRRPAGRLSTGRNMRPGTPGESSLSQTPVAMGVLIVGGLVALVGGGLLLFGGKSHSTVTVDPAESRPVAASQPPAAQKAPEAAKSEARFAQRTATGAAQRVDDPAAPAAPALDEGKSAFDAFEALWQDLGDDRKDERIALAREYLDKHGSSFEAARARVMLQRLTEAPAADKAPGAAQKPVETMGGGSAPPERLSIDQLVSKALEAEKRGAVEEALALYERAIKIDGRNHVVRSNMGNLKRMQGDLEGGLKEVEMALKRSPDFGNAWAVKAVILGGLGRDEEFKQARERAVKLMADRPEMGASIDSEVQRALLHRAGKQFENAEPQTAEQFMQRAQFRLAQKRWTEAIADFEQAVERDTALAAKGVYHAMAQAAERIPDYPKKIGYMRRWYQAAPENAEAANGYAWELLTCKDETLRDPRGALDPARKAADLSAHKNPAILDTYALALFRSGSLKEAVDTQKKAIDLLPAETTAEARKEYTSRLKEFEAALRLGNIGEAPVEMR